MVQGARQAGGQPEDHQREEDPDGQHLGRRVERARHAGARTALVGRQAVHDPGLVGSDEHAHADRVEEDHDGEPEIGEVDRQRDQEDEGQRRDDKSAGGEGAGAVAVGQQAADGAESNSPMVSGIM